MGKSRRKTPIRGVTAADSEKEDKRLLNRTLRRINRQRLKIDETGENLKQVKEVLDPWKMPKDGKFYFAPVEYGRLMRK